jgi:hypothetical protein
VKPQQHCFADPKESPVRRQAMKVCLSHKQSEQEDGHQPQQQLEARNPNPQFPTALRLFYYKSYASAHQNHLKSFKTVTLGSFHGYQLMFCSKAKSITIKSVNSAI